MRSETATPEPDTAEKAMIERERAEHDICASCDEFAERYGRDELVAVLRSVAAVHDFKLIEHPNDH